MQDRKIDKIEVSPLFWKDMKKLRVHPEYRAIRRQIGDMVLRTSKGKAGGDKPFSGKTFAGMRHMHVNGKMIVFTTYPDDTTMRICAVKKHDFYGYGKERHNAKEAAGEKLRAAAEASPVRSPEWHRLKWSTPAEIARHPELPELSRDGLEALYEEILAEGQSLAILERTIAGLPDDEAEQMSLAWLDNLISAQEACENHLVLSVRRRIDHLTPDVFEIWAEI